MNLLLFETDEHKAFPVIEKTDTRRENPYKGGSWWQKTRAKLYNSYQKLKERFDHGEIVCAGLRHAGFLQVYYSSQLSGREAETSLRYFLEESSSKHYRWLWIDGVLAFLGVFLTWVPGPNVFFFYPAVRAMSHYFALQGARRAQKLEMTFSVDERINLVQENLENLETVRPTVYALESSYNLESLDQQLRHLKKK